MSDISSTRVEYYIAREAIDDDTMSDVIYYHDIDKRLSEGWQLHGGPMIYNGVYILQAMTRVINNEGLSDG